MSDTRFARIAQELIDRAAIAADCEHVHAAARAALDAARIDLASVVLTLAGYAEDERKHHKHFKVGAASAMAEAAATWAADGFNVYRGLVANRAGLKKSERGGLDDVVAVFGFGVDLDADKGNAVRPEDLPMPPTMLLRTSGENFCPFYLLTRAVTVAEAKPIAWGLCEIAKDADGATKDVAHVWRIAGTLNHPKSSKLKRGRPPEPQRVALDHEDRGTGQPVSAEALSEALEVALGVESLAAAFAKATGMRADALPLTGRRVYSQQDAGRWNGDEREIARVEDALKRVCADSREVWLKIGMALHDYSRGDDWAYRLWSAWSQGDAARGFTGSAKFDAADQGQTWESFGQEGARRVQIGTLFRFAQNNGWDARRKRFGLASLKETLGGAVSEDVAEVLVAAEAMPRGNLFNEAREGWFDFVIENTKSVARIRVAKAISRFINLKRGYGWAGYHRLAMNTAVDPASTPLSTDDVGDHVRGLAKDGFIRLSSGKTLNVLGKRGAMYAVTPPPNWTWDGLLARRRLLMNHAEDTAWENLGGASTPPNTPLATPINTPAQGGIDGYGTPLDTPAQGGIGGSKAYPSIPLPRGVSEGVIPLDTPLQGGTHYQTVFEEKGETAPAADSKAADTASATAAEPPQSKPPIDLTRWLGDGLNAPLPEHIHDLLRRPSEEVVDRELRRIDKALSHLRGLQLSDQQLRDVVESAHGYVDGGETTKRNPNGTGKTADDLEPLAYAKKLANSLEKHARKWVPDKIAQGRLVPGLVAPPATNGHEAAPATSSRDAHLVRWRRFPADTFKAPLTNEDIAQLAEEPEFLEIADMGAFRNAVQTACDPFKPRTFVGGSDVAPKRPNRDEAMRRARHNLRLLQAAKPNADLKADCAAREAGTATRDSYDPFEF